MIKTISLKCPECEANLSIEGDLKQCFCEYCGAKIMIDVGSTITCSQCGKELSETSKFCGNCGCRVTEEGKNNFVPPHRSSFDAVEDIQKKLRNIDNRKKPQTKKEDVIKSAINVVKGKTSILEAMFEEDFEGKKLEDKKHLISNYRIPKSSNELANFAKYINTQIEIKKKEPDPLTEVWKEKLNQVYLYAKKEFSAAEEFAEIKKYYKSMKRRERHETLRVFVWFLLYPILGAFILSIVNQWPLMMFASILAAGWGVFLVLYVYDVLDKMVTSIIQHSEKRPNVPKWLRAVAWIILIPALAALITAIVYHWEGLIFIFAVLFGVDAFFLLLFLCDVYGW